MKKTSSILGALALCALALCAFGAANASAAQGLTAVTCKEVTAGTGNYKTSACETPKAAGGNFETSALPLNETTEATGEGVGNAVLRATIATVKVEVVCEKTTITGHVKNSEPVALEHKITGNKIVIDYQNCFAASQSNTEKRCEVESITGTAGIKGTVATNALKSVSATGESHNVTFEPEEGTSFAELKILAGGACGVGGVTVKATGSIVGVANTEKHNHITFTPETNGTLFKANGGAASYEGTSNAVMKGTTNLIGAETAIPPAVKGLTAVTCTEVATGAGNYKTSACETPKAAGGNFETSALPLNETTEATGEGVGNAVLRATIATVKVEVVCEKTTITGHVKNSEPVALEHKITGNKIVIDYQNCFAASQSNTEKRCEVESITGTAGIKGTVATNALKSVSATGESHNVTFEPEEGTSFAELKILAGGACGVGGVTVKATGSIVGVANTEKHNHITFTPETNGTLFKANGGAASYEGTSNAVMKGTTNLIGAETFT